MVNRNDDGVYAKTDAYNFLKDLLDISHSVKIYRSFFNLFFTPLEEGFYKLNFTESEVIDIFNQGNIRDKNMQYFNLKITGEKDEAEKIRKNIMSCVPMAA